MQAFANSAPPRRSYGDPFLAEGAWQGVRTRRVMAFGLDVVVLGTLAFLIPVAAALVLGPIGLAAGVMGFGLSWLIIPPLMPIIAFFYNGVTVSGVHRGTPGMRMMGLEIRHVDGGAVPFVNAGLHAVLLYFSWTFPVVFLVSLITRDKSCLHDLLAHVRVMRR